MVEQVRPGLLFELFVAQSPGGVGSEAGNAELVFADVEGFLLVVAAVTEPLGKEAGMVNALLQFVHQFKAAHDGHEVVGVLNGAVTLVGDDARGGVVAQGFGTLKEAMREMGDGVHASKDEGQVLPFSPCSPLPL